MNGKKARALRRMAREEMVGNPERELVIARVRGSDRIINEPLTVRSMNNALKRAYKAAPKVRA